MLPKPRRKKKRPPKKWGPASFLRKIRYGNKKTHHDRKEIRSIQTLFRTFPFSPIGARLPFGLKTMKQQEGRIKIY